MTPDHLNTLRGEITRAHALATAGQTTLAVKSFDLAREMAHVWADPARLAKIVAHNQTELVEERTYYQDVHFKHGAGDDRKPLLVIGDSLGLPLADPQSGSTKLITKIVNRLKPERVGSEATYPWMLGYAVHGYQPTAICQRYFTTDDAVATLAEDPALAQTDAAIIHLGLNDCANRIFLESERLALSLLSVELRDQIVGFARKYRREILRQLPSRHYVDPERFLRNLNVLVATLKRGGCKKIILTTIILPPSKFWPGTPGVNENFGRYNLAIMSAAQMNDVILFDLNRLVAEHGLDDALHTDGMHLSDAGHKLFERQVIKLLQA